MLDDYPRHRRSPNTPNTDLLSKHPSHTLKHAVLVRIIRVVFTWDLQHGRKRVCEGIDTRPNSFGDLALSPIISIPIHEQPRNKRSKTHMLVDKDDCNILSLLGEVLEGLLDR